MAGKILEYELVYWKKGVQFVELLEISFVSNWCVKEYNAIMQIAFEVQTKWDRLSDIQTLLAANGDIEDLDSLISERDGLLESLGTYEAEKIESRRFELITTLLEDNGIKNEELYTFNFWERHVDPSSQIDFITTCGLKDIPKKKVV